MMFSVIVVMFGIFNEVNNPPWNHSQSHPVLEFFLFWSMLTWIAMLEGCQISVVGLQGFDPESFRDTHPRAYAWCKLGPTSSVSLSGGSSCCSSTGSSSRGSGVDKPSTTLRWAAGSGPTTSPSSSIPTALC